MQRVRQFHQDANIGPTIEDVQLPASIGKQSIRTVSRGWNVLHNDLRKVHITSCITATRGDRCFWTSVPWVGIHSPCCFMCSGPCTGGVGY